LIINRIISGKNSYFRVKKAIYIIYLMESKMLPFREFRVLFHLKGWLLLA
jgi:hypothetical protein